ncbi:MAG: recombinase family protein [Oscillospiraceae bacterium]
MRNNGDQIAIYSRKSKFTGKGESIGNQVELCREYARAHYGDAALESLAVYEDEGFSGGDLNRPAFRKMMEAARKRGFRAIIVYRLDRVSRNVSDFSGLIEELTRLDIAFVSIREQFDTATPMGRAMMYIASVFSQLERETIAERIRDNMHELAKTGRWLGGITPTGYASEAVKSVTIDGKTRKACKLKLIPEEAALVKTIYDLYVETDSQSATEAELMKRGIQTKNGKAFTRFSIKAILQNPVYAIADRDTYDYLVKADADLFSSREDFDGVHGLMAYNRTRQEKGKATRFLPPEEWIVSVGLHPGLIPGRVWVGVQESLARGKTGAYHSPRGNEALLTGLLYCACGGRMYPKQGRRETADGRPVYAYVCKRKERSRGGVCKARNVSGNTLDAAVLGQLKGLEEDSNALTGLLEQSRGFVTGDSAGDGERLAALRREKAAAEKKIGALVDSLPELGDSAAKNHVARRIEELSQACAEIDGRIREREDLASPRPLSDRKFEETRQLLAAFGDSLDETTVEQKRAAIRSLVRRVVWDGTEAHVTLFGAEAQGEKTPWCEDSK